MLKSLSFGLDAFTGRLNLNKTPKNEQPRLPPGYCGAKKPGWIGLRLPASLKVGFKANFGTFPAWPLQQTFAGESIADVARKKLEWWRDRPGALPHWAMAVQKSCERSCPQLLLNVFSLLDSGIL